MSQSEVVSKERARHALENVTGASVDSLMHFGSYSTDRKGGSMRATVAAEFVDYHGLVKKDGLVQFFDPETGALVVVPEGACDQWPSMEAD